MKEEKLRTWAIKQAIALVVPSSVSQKEKAVFATAENILTWIKQTK